MSETETPTTPEEHETHHEFSVTVNDKPVTLKDHHQTGLSIKEASIDQGVPIQADFELSEVLHDGKQKPIGNDKKVDVKEGDKFWAIPGDDNS
jgi:hypothetical protein